MTTRVLDINFQLAIWRFAVLVNPGAAAKARRSNRANLDEIWEDRRCGRTTTLGHPVWDHGRDYLRTVWIQPANDHPPEWCALPYVVIAYGDEEIARREAARTLSADQPS